MSNCPDWMLPEGTHGVRAAQVRKDWRNRARAARSMEAANLVVGQVCDNLFEGRDPFAGMGEKS